MTYDTEESEEQDISKPYKEDKLKPLEVTITNHPEPIKEKNPTSEDTVDEYSFTPTDEEIKEMQDAQ